MGKISAQTAISPMNSWTGTASKAAWSAHMAFNAAHFLAESLAAMAASRKVSEQELDELSSLIEKLKGEDGK